MNVSTVSFLFALGIASTGCVGLEKKEADLGEMSVSTSAKFSIGEVTNATGQTFDFDIKEEFKTELLSQLKGQGLVWNGAESGNHFVINAEILDYAKGDAFTRWLAAGVGRTLLDVQCSITEADSAKEVGKVKVSRTIDTGGLFSAGQWKTVFKTVAKDVVRELKAKLPSQPATKRTHKL